MFECLLFMLLRKRKKRETIDDVNDDFGGCKRDEKLKWKKVKGEGLSNFVLLSLPLFFSLMIV